MRCAQGAGVAPEPRHFNPIILAEALEGGLEQASDFIYEMANSEGSNLSPDVGSFNALLQVRASAAGCLSVSGAVQNAYFTTRIDCLSRRAILCCHSPDTDSALAAYLNV